MAGPAGCGSLANFPEKAPRQIGAFSFLRILISDKNGAPYGSDPARRLYFPTLRDTIVPTSTTHIFRSI